MMEIYSKFNPIINFSSHWTKVDAAARQALAKQSKAERSPAVYKSSSIFLMLRPARQQTSHAGAQHGGDQCDLTLFLEFEAQHCL
ncbi:hypothetical protein RRG08_032977 [Elysia crispata]|uniref:Uncharacterized protein n=1 Tax=Elysia crispata TaxID=231223 RepID=A0AAE0YRV8_9GAST|nr:hypothetical protein RRG08_032977 [Elysia crispata]